MDETIADSISLCEKYPNHKAKGITKKKGKEERELAFEAFGLTKEGNNGK